MIDWINVNDRLPEVGEWVLFQFDGGRVERGTYGSLTGLQPKVTHWYPYNPPVKKRWQPKGDIAQGEKYWWIDPVGKINVSMWNAYPSELEVRSYTGCYKTREEAEAMAQKIREFITKEIGEC